VTGVVRFGAGSLAELGEVLAEVDIERALLVATRRGARSVSGLPVVGVYDGVEPHVPAATVRACAALAQELRADGLVGLGGGSAVDTCKAVAAELATARADPPRVVAVPTTYAGAEWTSFFGVLLEPGRKGGGSDPRSRPVAAVYDPELTLELPPGATVGTAMNALAHCAEAYYHPATGEAAALEADAGAAAIADALPRVVERPASLEGRTRLLEGAMHAALALGLSGLCLAHAMAQGLGGRYGLPQGAMNALCLPAALRFNAEAVPGEVARFAAALGAEDGPARCVELARLGGFERLRQYAVEEADLGGVAEEIAGRAGARANPRPASPAEIELLLLEIW
jgi:maleylacetate reductase